MRIWPNELRWAPAVEAAGRRFKTRPIAILAKRTSVGPGGGCGFSGTQPDDNLAKRTSMGLGSGSRRRAARFIPFPGGGVRLKVDVCGARANHGRIGNAVQTRDAPSAVRGTARISATCLGREGFRCRMNPSQKTGRRR